MPSDFAHDPHSQAGYPCPRNVFGLVDYLVLSEVERVYVQRRSTQLLRRGVTGRFDPAHLRDIHRDLFQDVYPWAGELRVVGLSKPGGAPFATPQFIEAAMDDLFTTLKHENWLQGRTLDDFAERAAYYLGEINAIHPFREGNGRTQREFVRQLAAHAGHTISWAGFTQEQMTVASILSHTRGDHRELASIIKAASVSVSEMPTPGQDL